MINRTFIKWYEKNPKNFISCHLHATDSESYLGVHQVFTHHDVEMSSNNLLLIFTGSPVKAESLPYKRKFSDSMLEDPRPFKFINMDSYNDHVRNTLVNYCCTSSIDLALRYNYGKADIQSAGRDHDYLEQPFLEYWVDQGIAVSII